MPDTPDGFLAAILAEPGDDTHRMVYADWLEERREPRGEFIRLQCELAKSPECTSCHGAGFTQEPIKEFREGLGVLARGQRRVPCAACTRPKFIPRERDLLHHHFRAWLTHDFPKAAATGSRATPQGTEYS